MVGVGARIGLVAYGVVHLLLAWLAARVGFGHEERADPSGALGAMAGEPFGGLLLWLLAAGFVAVAVWQARQAVGGFRRVPALAARLSRRLLAAGQVVLFGALAILAGRIASGMSSGGGGQDVTARLLGLAIGPPLVTAVGVGVVIAGAAIAWRGWRMGFTDAMDLERAAPAVRTLVERSGQLGSVAKGVAVGIIGVLVAIAGVARQPDKAEGLDVALKTLAAQPYGPALLVAVAFGFASYGVFAILDARYHRV